jgi:hypothetical protein
VINTNLNTKAAVRQMAHSRSPLELCVVDCLLRGTFGNAAVDENSIISDVIWDLDQERTIESQALDATVNKWLKDFGGRGAQYEARLHTIIDTFEKYVGKIESRRPKGTLNSVTKTRPQLPTLRLLPPRRMALDHALKEGLITDEEYESAVPADDDFSEAPVTDEPAQQQPDGRDGNSDQQVQSVPQTIRKPNMSQ